MMTEQMPKSFAFAVDAGGQASRTELSSAAVTRTDGFVWAHIYLKDEAALDWLAGSSGLDPIVAEALSAQETRPRFTRMGDGAIVNLRGVNLNPDAKPEDMISIRVGVEKGRVISVYLRPLQAGAQPCGPNVPGAGSERRSTFRDGSGGRTGRANTARRGRSQ